MKKGEVGKKVRERKKLRTHRRFFGKTTVSAFDMFSGRN